MIKVNVAMIVYNHEPYIKRALESVLMQNTTFSYKIIIGEDCSTDGTRGILEAYRNKYPDKIMLLNNKENIGATRNLYNVLMHCKGDYIAQLEGDDYWIDDYKLQKQIDFLENNQSYIAVAHNCTKVDEYENILNPVAENFLSNNKRECTIDDFPSLVLPGQTATMVYRNIFKAEFDFSVIYRWHYMIADITIYFLLVSRGKIYCMEDVMSAYRYVEKKTGTNWSSHRKECNVLFSRYIYIDNLMKYANQTCGIKNDMNTLRKSYTIRSIVTFIRHPSFSNAKVVKHFIKINKGGLLKYTFSKMFEKILRK